MALLFLFMKLTIAFITVFIILGFPAFCQKNLTKEEILKYWRPFRDKDSTAIVNSSKTLNVQLRKLVDSLVDEKIDSIIIVSEALVGYASNSKCDFGMFPITTYVLWNKDNTTQIKKIENTCTSEIKKDSILDLFGFYNNNKKKIESEVFMPVILDAKMNKDQTFTYTMSTIDHEPVYSFFYKTGNHERVFFFSESILENKKNLFHDHNLNLAAYRWWQLIQEEIEKPDNKPRNKIEP